MKDVLASAKMKFLCSEHIEKMEKWALCREMVERADVPGGMSLGQEQDRQSAGREGGKGEPDFLQPQSGF